MLNEIASTKQVLWEIAEATKHISVPPKTKVPELADSPENGLYFRYKNIDGLADLNFYELQHALYAAWRACDHTQGTAKKTNRARVITVYDECRRRGIAKFSSPL